MLLLLSRLQELSLWMLPLLLPLLSMLVLLLLLPVLFTLPRTPLVLSSVLLLSLLMSRAPPLPSWLQFAGECDVLAAAAARGKKKRLAEFSSATTDEEASASIPCPAGEGEPSRESARLMITGDGDEPRRSHPSCLRVGVVTGTSRNDVPAAGSSVALGGVTWLLVTCNRRRCEGPGFLHFEPIR